MYVLNPLDAKVLQQLQHRLEGQLGVGPVPAAMPGGPEPCLDVGFELLRRHAGESRRQDLFEVLHRQFGDRLLVTRQDSLEGLDVLQRWLLFDDSGNTIQAVNHLGVHRMLDPQCAVLVEGHDAIFGRNELRGPPLRGLAHERQNRVLRRAVIPRRQRIGCVWLSKRPPRAGRDSEDHHQGQEPAGASQHGRVPRSLVVVS